MRIPHLLAAAVAALLFHPFAAPAPPFYQATFQATCKVVNEQGKIVTHKITTKDLIQQCADAHGIDRTNRKALTLVYHIGSDFNADALQVINAEDGTILCDVLEFAFGTVITNADHTQIEWQAFAFNEDQSESVGSALITHRVRYNSAGETNRFQARGSFQIGLPANNPLGANVCSGRFVASKPVIPQTAP